MNYGVCQVIVQVLRDNGLDGVLVELMTGWGVEVRGPQGQRLFTIASVAL